MIRLFYSEALMRISLCWLFLFHFALMLITEIIRVSLSFVFLTLGALLKYVLCYITDVFSVCVFIFFYFVCAVGNELTGNTNLITHYNLEHAYNKFCGKKVKEKLSNFLPELPGEFLFFLTSKVWDLTDMLFPSGFIPNGRGRCYNTFITACSSHSINDSARYRVCFLSLNQSQPPCWVSV